MENCSSWLAVVALVDSEAWLQCFADHMRVGRRSENTISSYRVTVKQFLRFLAVERGLESPHQIQAADIEAYQVSLERQLSFKGTPLTLATKNGKVSVVRAFVKFLRRTNVLMTDPVKDIVCPRQPRTILPELPTEEQVQRLLEAPDVSTPLGLRDRAVLELFYSSALRNSELRLLKVGDIDFARLQVRVHRGKGGRGRVVPVGETSAAWVEAYLSKARAFLLREKEHGFLFVTAGGKPFQVNRLVELVSGVAEKAGLPMRVTPHTLRHCCATHMLRNRVRFRHLQEFLGHESPSSTQIYTRVELTDLKEAHKNCHPRESYASVPRDGQR